ELICRVRAAPVDPKCALTTDLFDFSEAFLGEELTKSEGANGESNFQVHRLALVGDVIRRFVERRAAGARHDGRHDWRARVDLAIGSTAMPSDTRDEAGRTEKARALAELHASRISVLIGPAGSGKTTLLRSLCSLPEVRDGGILLLAPTGKARVRLEQVTGEAGAQTIAPIGRAACRDRGEL